MLPIILISDTPDKHEAFIQTLVAEESYLPYFIYKIEPIKTEISIDQIRAIKREIITDIPHKRLIIVYNFDTASLEAQNAFLKTLEEKNEKNQFVLVVIDHGRVLPTIQSRSKTIDLVDKNQKRVVDDSMVKLIEELEKKTGYDFLSSTASMNREAALTLFDEVIILLKEKLPKGEKSTATVLKKALQQKSLLLNNNLNPQLAVDAFLLFYRRQSVL